MLDLDFVIAQLDKHRQRATYGAVAAVTGKPATFLMAGRPRDSQHCWIVNQQTHLPTGYDANEIHPDFALNAKVIVNGDELIAWLSSRAPLPPIAIHEQRPPAENPWTNLTTGELLSAYDGIMRALRGRDVIRSSNNPVADLAEMLASRAFGLTLSRKSAKGHDALDSEGGRWQVKGRRRTTENKRKQLGVLRGLNEHRFDWLLAILFDEQFNVTAAYRIPHAAVCEHARYRETHKAHILTLNGRVLSDARCENVTLEVQVAAETYFQRVELQTPLTSAIGIANSTG